MSGVFLNILVKILYVSVLFAGEFLIGPAGKC